MPAETERERERDRHREGEEPRVNENIQFFCGALHIKTRNSNLIIVIVEGSLLGIGFAVET